MITYFDLNVAERRLIDLKESFAKDRGWSPAPSRMFGDMWAKHLPAGKMTVSLDTVVDLECQRDAAAAETMANVPASAAVQLIKEMDAKGEPVGGVVPVNRATSDDHASQRPPTHPNDGDHLGMDIMRLAGLLQNRKAQIAILQVDGNVVGAGEIVHDVNSPGIIIKCRTLKESDGEQQRD